MNTVLAQEYVALKVGETITENNPNLQVIFENAIVPDWKGGKITFNNVFVSKRPQVNNAGAGVTGKKIKNTFSKGSQREAAERAKLALSEKQLLINENSFDKGNYAQYDLTIDQVNVSLNFSKWFSGKGIIDELEINGVRGVVDRTHVIWKEHDDPRNYLNVHKPGDFELDKFVMNDVLFTLYQPNGFRPFKVSIFNCELPRLRKHWFFYDLLNATAISGTYDNSLFTIHKKFTPDSGKKQHNYIYVDDPITIVTTMRVDNLNIDHLNAGIKGPFGWITRGQVDMVGNIRVVPISATGKIPVIVNPKEFLENLLLSSDYDHMKNNKMIIDFYLKLHNVEAQVPLLTSELSYINNALIRPIVGYINSRKATYIPINCRIVKNLDDFAGSWTIYDSLLMDNLSEKVYDSFAAYVVDDERRSLRVKRIGFWSLQLMLQLILMSLGALA
ncbi:related to Mitochondrial distribution and morphology protein 31 [Saccharomycodes ludwigii]|uniref:Related to Mitochondrial distribution and morphology protein 31 n=2 Tax=Saccharomycodes ludwigii TaxID=36035 RepID=A0A376BC88_9ASCO|nr:related to Mitochondrial distribution and morphology protein 31 [Saccharomycodes ludwigii]